MAGNPVLENPFVQGVLKSWDYAFKGKYAAVQVLLRIVARVGPLAAGGDEIMNEIRDLALAGIDRDLCPKCFQEAVPQKEEAGEKDSEGPKVQSANLSPKTVEILKKELDKLLVSASKADNCLGEMERELNKAFEALGLEKELTPESGKEPVRMEKSRKGEVYFVCRGCGRRWREEEVLKGGNRVVYGAGWLASLGKGELKRE